MGVTHPHHPNPTSVARDSTIRAHQLITAAAAGDHAATYTLAATAADPVVLAVTVAQIAALVVHALTTGALGPGLTAPESWSLAQADLAAAVAK